MSKPDAQFHRSLERLYLGANTNKMTPCSIAISEGECTVTMPIDERYMQAAHSLHGMFYGKVADESAFYAAQSLEPEFWLVTSAMQVYMLRAIYDGELRAKATVVKAGRRQILVDVSMYADDDQLAGTATLTFLRSSLNLADIPEYSR